MILLSKTRKPASPQYLVSFCASVSDTWTVWVRVWTGSKYESAEKAFSENKKALDMKRTEVCTKKMIFTDIESNGERNWRSKYEKQENSGTGCTYKTSEKMQKRHLKSFLCLALEEQ